MNLDDDEFMAASSKTSDAGASNSNGAARNPSPNGNQPVSKGAQLLLQRLARMPLAAISEALSRDESTACRIRSGEQRVTLHEAVELIQAAGCKIVEAGSYCVPRNKYEMLASYFEAGMADEENRRRYLWEGEA